MSVIVVSSDEVCELMLGRSSGLRRAVIREHGRSRWLLGARKEGGTVTSRLLPHMGSASGNTYRGAVSL